MISENLDLLMSLVGSLTCTLVCLVFPAALDTITFWHKMDWIRLTKNAFIILLGLAALCTGTTAAMMALNHYFDSIVENERDGL